MAIKVYSVLPKAPAIRLFNVISRRLFGGEVSYSSVEKQYSTASANRTGHFKIAGFILFIFDHQQIHTT